MASETETAADPGAPSSDGRPAKKPKASSPLRSAIELIGIIALAVGLALGIQALIVKPYRIPSGSMEPTLDVGQRVLVNRIGTDFSGPHVGQVTVFHPPAGADEQFCGPSQGSVSPGGAACSSTNPHEASVNFVKRIVAGPGDQIYISGGHVFRKAAGSERFVREKDGYIKPCDGVPECSFPQAITIPAGHWFMMGDNRGESDDSRFWGPVPTAWIIGPAVATYWPPDRVGFF